MSYTYTEARRQLKSLFDHVCNAHEPTVIHRKNGGNVVVMAEDDFKALEETAYLLRAPANARRLLEAIERAKRREAAVPLEDAIEQLGLDEAAIAD